MHERPTGGYERSTRATVGPSSGGSAESTSRDQVTDKTSSFWRNVGECEDREVRFGKPSSQGTGPILLRMVR